MDNTQSLTPAEQRQLKLKQCVSNILQVAFVTDLSDFDRLEQKLPAGDFPVMRLWVEFSDLIGEATVSRDFVGGSFRGFNFTLWDDPEEAHAFRWAQGLYPVEASMKPKGKEFCLMLLDWEAGSTTSIKLLPKRYANATDALIAWTEGKPVSEYLEGHPIHTLLPNFEAAVELAAQI